MEHWKRGSDWKDENDLVPVVGGIGGGIVIERSIGVEVAGSEGEEPIGEDGEDGSSESDLDLPEGGDEKSEDGEIHGGYSGNGHNHRSEREGRWVIERRSSCAFSRV